MSRIAHNYHRQAEYLERKQAEHFELLTQQVQCWQMYGMRVIAAGSTLLVSPADWPPKWEHTTAVTMLPMLGDFL